MKIAVIAFDESPDIVAKLPAVVAAINRQLAEHFTPAWSIDASVYVAIKEQLSSSPSAYDAVAYVQHGLDVSGALGYHDETAKGLPVAYVSTDLAEKYGEDWSVTLSHEILELAGNPDVDEYCMGERGGRTVFYWHEMCDAVQGSSYKIDGINVSNFVLPAYFKPGKPGATNYLDEPLAALGVQKGGYMGYFDPRRGKIIEVTGETIADGGSRVALKKSFPGSRIRRRKPPILGEGATVEADLTKLDGVQRGESEK